MLGLVTLVIRYRKQRNNLLKVVKQEGGLYLALALGDCAFRSKKCVTQLIMTFTVLGFIIALEATPTIPVSIPSVHSSFSPSISAYAFNSIDP